VQELLDIVESLTAASVPLDAARDESEGVVTA
jgi:hypothetical protein